MRMMGDTNQGASSVTSPVVRALVVTGFVSLAAPPFAAAQSSWATLSAPPTEMVPAGDVLRAGHLGREIAETHNIIHFYSDVIGLGLVGARDATRRFMVSRPLAEFAELGEGDQNAFDSVSRVALLPIPGTAAKPGDPEMTIEAIEIKGIKSQVYNPPLSDPGASHLTLIVRDLDKTLAALKGRTHADHHAGRQSGGAVGLARHHRQDPRDLRARPGWLSGAADADHAGAGEHGRRPIHKVLGARVTLVVDNLEETARVYQSLVGPDLKFWLSPMMGDKTHETVVEHAGAVPHGAGDGAGLAGRAGARRVQEPQQEVPQGQHPGPGHRALPVHGEGRRCDHLARACGEAAHAEQVQRTGLPGARRCARSSCRIRRASGSSSWIAT